MWDYSELLKLIERAKQGDESAFSGLYERTCQIVYNLACSAMEDEEEAKDIVSEVYIRVFRGLPGLEENRSFMRWLMVITQNVCRDHLAEAKKAMELAPLFPESAEGNDPIAQWQDKEATRLLLQELIHHLPEVQQRAIYYVYFQQMTVGQAAALEGCPINTIKSRLYYARQALRKAILEEEKRTGDKYHLPASALVLAAMMALPQVGFSLAAEEAAQIFSVVMSALGIKYSGAEAITFVTAVQPEEEGNWLQRLWARRYVIKVRPVVLVLLSIVVLTTVVLLGMAAVARLTDSADGGQSDLPLSGQEKANSTSESPDKIIVAPQITQTAETTTALETTTTTTETTTTTSETTTAAPETTAVPVVQLTGEEQVQFVNGVRYTYRQTDEGAVVTRVVVEEPMNSLEIPSELGGLPVAEVVAVSIENCQGITELILPNTIKRLTVTDRPHAFALMPDLQKIRPRAGGDAFWGFSGVLYSYDQSTLLIFPAGIKKMGIWLDNRTVKIAPYSFCNPYLKEIGLPDGIIELGDGCFMHCANLENIKLPYTVTTVGVNALGSPGLKEITVGGGSQHFSSSHGALYSRDQSILYRYPAGAEAEKYVLQEQAKVIVAHAFHRADRLKEIVMQDDVVELQPYALADMANLQTISFSDVIRTIPAYALANNPSLQSCRLPAGVTHVDKTAFSGCTALQELIIPSGLTFPDGLIGLPDGVLLREYK